MTPDELRERISRTFGNGHGSLKEAARALPINYDNLRKMLSPKNERPVAKWIESRMDEIDRLARIDPPPVTLHENADRDGPCALAIEPHLDNLLARAETVGWLPPEVITATLGWAIHQVADNAGPVAALDLLDAAREAILLRGDG